MRIKQVSWETVASTNASRVVNEDVEPLGLEPSRYLGKKYFLNDIYLHIYLVNVPVL